jgi:hypothetical protein
LVELETCLIELSLGVFELLLKSLGFLSLEIILNLENLLLSSEVAVEFAEAFGGVSHRDG